MSAIRVSALEVVMLAKLSERQFGEVVAAAMAPAKLAGMTLFGDPRPRKWLSQDHPTRVNLILETLGYEVRL